METNDRAVIFEPGTGRALGYGWERMKANALVFLLAVFVTLVVESPMPGNSYDFGNEPTGPIYNLLSFAYFFLFLPVISYGIDLIFLQGVRGDKIEMKTFFAGFNNYVNVILAHLLFFGLVLIGFVVFIVPGIYIFCRLIFTSLFVMDEGLDPVAAVEASWRLTRGHTLKIFLLSVFSIIIFILGLLILIVGIIPALMWIKAAFASLYLSISQNSGPEEQGTIEAP